MMRGAFIEKGEQWGTSQDSVRTSGSLSPAVMRGVLTLIRVGVVEKTISSDLQSDQAHRGVLGGAP